MGNVIQKILAILLKARHEASEEHRLKGDNPEFRTQMTQIE